jgi:hypothetical protein
MGSAEARGGGCRCQRRVLHVPRGVYSPLLRTRFPACISIAYSRRILSCMWLQLLFKCKWCTVWYTRSPLAQGDCGDELTLPVAAEASPGLAEAKTEINSLEFARPWRRIKVSFSACWLRTKLRTTELCVTKPRQKDG